MCADPFHPAPSVATVLGPVYGTLFRANERLGRLRHPIGHTLRVASEPDLLRAVPCGDRTRSIPSPWGVRRDDYAWRGGMGPDAGPTDEMTVFRDVAANLAYMLAAQPLPAWASLLPGTMDAVIGSRSALHLADYWTLFLHHLVWTGRLSYRVDAEWTVGASVHDKPFAFTSRLPANLIELSQDALMLLQESALAAANGKGTAAGHDCRAGPSGIAFELPIYRDGHWHVRRIERDDGDRTGEPAVPAASDKVSPPAGRPATTSPGDLASDQRREPTSGEGTPAAECEDATDEQNGSLVLDEQTFTVRHRGAECQFKGRNMLLFALLARVVRRPGHKVDFASLTANGDVWDGYEAHDATIRGAVYRLRNALKAAGMTDLAARLRTGSYARRRHVILVSEETPDPIP